MRAMALRIADELAATIERRLTGDVTSETQLHQAPGSSTGGGPKSAGWVIPASPAESLSEIELLLRWLVDSHFTFLGFREYDLVSEADGLALRHSGASASCGTTGRTTQLSSLSAQGGGYTDPATADRDEGELGARPHRAQLPDYVGIGAWMSQAR